MYCPVYSWNSDIQKIQMKGSISLAFQAVKRQTSSTEEKHGLNSVSANHSSLHLVRESAHSVHFAEDVYDPAHSPQYLQLTGWTNNIRLLLKKDALPTLKKPATSASIPTATLRKTRKLTEKKHRDKVIKRSI